MHTEAHTLHYRMVALRVRRPAHHHRQLRGPRPRRASAKGRQDHTRTEARGHGALLPRDLLRRGESQDPRPRLRPPPRLLPAQHLEHYGLLRRGDRVRVKRLLVSNVSLFVRCHFSSFYYIPVPSRIFYQRSSNILRVLEERKLPEIVNFFYRLLDLID